jgi:hypothetical protein
MKDCETGGACSTHRSCKNEYMILESPKEMDYLINQDVDGRMKCSCTLREQNMAWNGFSWD